MKNKDFLLIRGTVFPFDVLVTTENTSNLLSYIGQHEIELTPEEVEALEMEDNVRGKTIPLSNKSIVIRLRDKRDVPVISHEISHAIFAMMEVVGIHLCEHTDEVFAYLQQYYLEEIMNHYKLWIK